MMTNEDAIAVAIGGSVKKADPYHLERARLAYQTIDAFGWNITWKHDRNVPDDAWPIDIIANAILAAERRGEERMREALKIACKAMNDYLAGDYANPRDARPGKCEHGIFYFEPCENCIDAHFQLTLARIAELVPEMGE